jgi:hypothetical protein
MAKYLLIDIDGKLIIFNIDKSFYKSLCKMDTAGLIPVTYDDELYVHVFNFPESGYKYRKSYIVSNEETLEDDSWKIINLTLSHPRKSTTITCNYGRCGFI